MSSSRSGSWTWSLSVLVLVLVLAACGRETGTAPPTASPTPGPVQPSPQPPPPAAQGVTDNELLIGGFGPMSGPLSFIGLGARAGIEMAIEEINEAGGIDGRMLRLIFEDADSPAESVAAARKLVERDRVFAIILGSGSVGAAAAADYLRESGIPAYNIVSLTPAIREPFAPNIFHGTVPNAPELTQNLVDEVVGRTDPRPEVVGMLGARTEFVDAYLGQIGPIIEAEGVELVIERFELGAEDFTSPLVSLRNRGVDAILYAGGFAEAARAIRQAPELGLADQPWVLDGAAVSSAIPAVAGEAAEGVRSAYAFPIFPGEDQPTMVEFERRWREKYGDPPPGRPGFTDLAGYGDTYVFAVAVREAGDDLSWENLIATWENLRDVSPTTFGDSGLDVIYPETFAPTDRQGNRVVSTIQIVDGRWQVVSSQRILQ